MFSFGLAKLKKKFAQLNFEYKIQDESTKESINKNTENVKASVQNFEEHATKDLHLLNHGFMKQNEFDVRRKNDIREIEKKINDFDHMKKELNEKRDLVVETHQTVGLTDPELDNAKNQISEEEKTLKTSEQKSKEKAADRICKWYSNNPATMNSGYLGACHPTINSFWGHCHAKDKVEEKNQNDKPELPSSNTEHYPTLASQFDM